VKLFTCGPSVYRPQHIGNYRTFFFEDILQRYLQYCRYEVQREINYTDIEDKSIGEAQQKGIGIDELTKPVEHRFIETCRRLALRLPDMIPRSSTSVATAAAIIARLIDTGNAYRHGVNIYFDPTTFEGFGKLFGLDMRRWPKKKFDSVKIHIPDGGGIGAILFSGTATEKEIRCGGTEKSAEAAVHGTYRIRP
jgi:cysteinyl-tRNA synthetase